MNIPNPQVEEENLPILPDQENVNSFSTDSSTNNDIKGIEEDPSDSKNKSNVKGRR